MSAHSLVCITIINFDICDRKVPRPNIFCHMILNLKLVQERKGYLGGIINKSNICILFLYESMLGWFGRISMGKILRCNKNKNTYWVDVFRNCATS